ncbi:hypothetical protein Flavo103_36730 [Flavobacterium collinsii]|uniref:restriction endonuclease n=1 Tax=Flavobacterium collinsii TaxID=1114861 RepID=UPI0022C71F41|nr:hypothetical protein [Flavobacterium collinsii]GIQ60537.1 hypothetical protein Flavo103_36730 [Flavobacterium collinsii]
MKAKQQLRKPENWSDFENLCKKLWGEIWKCPEIKKNGRSGQSQNGIDVSAIPFGEDQYYGIQCKGKDDYTNSNLTEKEIDKEIKLALNFQPTLKKMYFATTANKDAKIEEYVRKKNIEHLKNKLFEVHLYSWEDIVDLIDENKQTHDYYVRSLNFKTEHQVLFTFENNENEYTIEVPFRRKISNYRQKIVPADTSVSLSSMLFNQFNMDRIKPYSMSTFNHSYARFYFRIQNLGSEPLQEFKIFLDFEGDFESINTCTKGHYLISNPNIQYDTFIWNEDKQGKIIPLKNILVQDDTMGFDTICLKPFNKNTEVKIHWKLVSLNYKTEGDLKLNIKPTYKIKEETILIEDPLKVRIEENIEDYITEGNDDEK